jgi:hypothetical protein
MASGYYRSGITQYAGIMDIQLERAGYGLPYWCSDRGILSFFIWILKAPFTMITPVVGLLVGVIGLIVRANNNNLCCGFLGGILYFEWGLSGTHVTTFGWIVNAFRGSMSGNIIPQHRSLGLC